MAQNKATTDERICEFWIKIFQKQDLVTVLMILVMVKNLTTKVAHQMGNRVMDRLFICQWITGCEMADENIGPGFAPVA